MFEGVDWSHGKDHMLEKHGVTPAEADEALADTHRVVIDPDYNSKSGRSVRIIGYSPSAGELLSVLVIEDQGTEYGINGWPSNSRDHRIYREENES